MQQLGIRQHRPVVGCHHLGRQAIQRIPRQGMAFVGAQDQAHWRVLIWVGPMLLGIVAVHMHLPHIGMGQATQLQVDDDQAAQLAMEEQQIDPIPGLVDTQPALPPDEGEAFPQFQQEVFQPLDQGTPAHTGL